MTHTKHKRDASGTKNVVSRPKQTRHVYGTRRLHTYKSTKKQSWKPEEDKMLLVVLSKYDLDGGKVKWSCIANKIPNRNGKQCRERWVNHLRPDIKKGKWTNEEDKAIIELQQRHGNKWTMIARILQRADNDVKNHWNSKEFIATRKRLEKADTIESPATSATTDNLDSKSVIRHQDRLKVSHELEDSRTINDGVYLQKFTSEEEEEDPLPAGFKNFPTNDALQGPTGVTRLNKRDQLGNSKTTSFERTAIEYSQNQSFPEAKKVSKIKGETALSNLSTTMHENQADASSKTCHSILCTPIPKKDPFLCHSLINSASVFHNKDRTPTMASFRGRTFFSPNISAGDTPRSDFYDMSTPFASGECSERVAV